MEKWCFKEKDSVPPICGIHKVRLVVRWTSQTPLLAGLGNFAFLMCPTSGHVVSDPPDESGVPRKPLAGERGALVCLVIAERSLRLCWQVTIAFPAGPFH